MLKIHVPLWARQHITQMVTVRIFNKRTAIYILKIYIMNIFAHPKCVQL